MWQSDRRRRDQKLKSDERVCSTWKEGREYAILADGNGVILWRKSGFGPIPRPKIWMTSNGIHSMCVGKEAGRCVCAWVPSFNVQKPRRVIQAESFWDQQATCWHPDWSRQGALRLKAERQSICVRSSSQKANVPQRGSGTVLPRSHRALSPLRPRWKAEWGWAHSNPARLPARLTWGLQSSPGLCFQDWNHEFSTNILCKIT